MEKLIGKGGGGLERGYGGGKGKNGQERGGSSRMGSPPKNLILYCKIHILSLDGPSHAITSTYAMRSCVHACSRKKLQFCAKKKKLILAK